MPSPVCHMDVGSLSCGPYQIKLAYWQDATQKGGSLMGGKAARIWVIDVPQRRGARFCSWVNGGSRPVYGVHMLAGGREGGR